MPAMLTRVCTTLAMFILFSSTAYALHEIDHRFTISGYVRDDAGASQNGKDVVVKDADGGTMGKAKTGSSGFYSIKLHLHSTDLGKKLEIATGTETQEISVQFDPDNVKDERTVEVNFGAEGVVTAIWESPAFLAVSGAVLVGGAAYVFTTQRRKKLKRAKQGGKSRKQRKKS